MSESTTTAPAGDPLRAMVANWSQAEASRSEDLDRMLSPLEEAVSRLAQWADDVAAAEQAESERHQEAEAREQAAEDRRRRLEHDLKLARSRVVDLEQALQARTEELLRAQAANNALAAELQSIGADEPLADEPLDGDPPPETEGVSESASGGVAERFARLRRS